MVSAKFQIERTENDFIAALALVKFEFRMKFGRITYIATML